MAATETEPSTADAQPVNILLVDDEPAVLQSIRRLLNGGQYQLHLAETGADALACLADRRIDVVLSDIHMPRMRGTELLAQIAARWPDTTRIALTGAADIDDAVEAINNGGIFRWLSKPWDPEELRQTVRDAAMRAQKVQAIRRRMQASSNPSQLEECVPHVIKRFFRGEILFTEGSPGHQVHFIRFGQVELAMERDGRRLILDVRGAGDCIGAGAALVGGARAATATATELTETFAVTRETLDALVARGDPLIASALKSLAEQSRRTLQRMVTRDPLVNPIISAAHTLDLMARAASGPSGISGRAGPPVTLLPEAEVVEVLGSVTGMLKGAAEILLEQMASLNIIAIDAARLVYVKQGEIIVAAKRLHATHGHSIASMLRAEAELLSIDEIAEMVGVEKALIQSKVKLGELPEDLWAFRKSAALRLINEKGRELFREPVSLPPQGVGDLGDLMLVDRDTLGRVLGRMGTDRLAVLLKGQAEPIRQRVLESLSKRMQAMLIHDIERVGEVDAAQVRALEAETLSKLRAQTSNDGDGSPR